VLCSAPLNPSRVHNELCSSPAVSLGSCTLQRGYGRKSSVHTRDSWTTRKNLCMSRFKSIKCWKECPADRNANTGQKPMDTIKNQEPGLVYLNLFHVFTSLKGITEYLWSEGETGSLVTRLVTRPSKGFKMRRELHLYGWRHPGNGKRRGPQTVCKTQRRALAGSLFLESESGMCGLRDQLEQINVDSIHVRRLVSVCQVLIHPPLGPAHSPWI